MQSHAQVDDAAARFVEVQELVMTGQAGFRAANKVEPVQRPSGQNSVGVVAWRLLLSI